MAEKMTLQQVRDRLRYLETMVEAESHNFPENRLGVSESDMSSLADAIDAHLAQPSQAEDRFEQYVATLIAKAPDVQKLGERLAHWLDDDQFNNIEPILLGIARAIGNAQAEGLPIETHNRINYVGHPSTNYPPLPTPPKAEE